ncbi:MAG: hypothetical protein RML36_14485 [Anaerolineae bacterium]|nr:hypothetical protein [Anaerolineae bacterium]
MDTELADGHPVIAYLGNRHYVVLVDKGGWGNYLINDPWKLTADQGQGIALERNDLRLRFEDIRQLVFIYPDRNAPTNAIADKYYPIPIGPATPTPTT